ncbi:MAG: DUF3307 domain-containing protein [Thermoplasmatota archaeon]
MIAAAAALLLAHLVGDFVLQTDWVWRNKRRLWGLLLHGAIHAALVLAALGPWIAAGDLATATSLRVAAAVGYLHILIDAVKTRGPAAYRTSWWGFVIDQALHVVSLAAVLWWSGLTLEGHGALARIYLGLAALVAAGPGLMHLIPMLLPQRDDRPEGAVGAGRRIGVLERWLALLFVAIGQPAALAFILAAKSLARFDQLKERRFAEDYLVGTLASMLGAVAVGIVLRVAWYAAP